MASKEELYVSLDYENYKLSKLGVLSSQIDLLNSLKYLQNLKVLARQKRDLKIILDKKVSTIISLIDSIKEKMPEPKIPKAVSSKIQGKKEETPKKVKIDYSKRNEIDEELIKIREKLSELNNL